MAGRHAQDAEHGLSVKGFGAKGDGTTDDTAAIQAAIDAVNAGGGGTVLVPRSSGAYLFTALIVKQGVRLRGTGGTLKLKSGTCSDAGTAYYPIQNAAASDVTIEDLIIDGNAAGQGAFQVCDAITVLGENVHVRRNRIIDPPDSGIMFSQVTNGSCVENRISTTSATSDLGIYVNDGDGDHSSENRIAGNQITGFPGGGIALKRISRRTIVTENTIRDCGNGITLENASTPDDYSTDVTIAMNRIRHVGYGAGSPAGRGIDLRMSDFVICIGNRIEDAKQAAIWVDGARYSTISGNVLTGSANQHATLGSGIYLTDRGGTRAPTGNQITGNIISGMLWRGFDLAGTLASSGNVIAQNVAVGSGSAGISISAVWSGNVIDSNVFGGTPDASAGAAANANIYARNRHVNGTVGGTIAGLTDYTTQRLAIGTNAARIVAHHSGTATWDPGSVADGATASITMTVAGATAGQTVAVGFSQPVPAGAFLSGSATANDTVIVTLVNLTGAPLDLASGTLRADCWEH